MQDFIIAGYSIPQLINTFFLYSFMGWTMECLVIRREKGYFENRGFARSPFCVIYGFGAMIGYAVLSPFSFNWVLLFFAGALIATVFEYLTARLMIIMFGNFWWDYTKKPLNYKGMLCLESTLGWGLISVLLFAGMHNGVVGLVNHIPENIANVTAFVLICGYALDFGLSMRKTLKAREELNENSSVYGS